MNDESCPYCGGDESKCDFDCATEHCSEAEYQARKRDAPTEAEIERSQRRLAAILGEPYPE